MDNYSNWHINKLYEGHIKRLRKINQSPEYLRETSKSKKKQFIVSNTIHVKSKNGGESPKSEQKKPIRHRTEPSQKKSQRMTVPIPLIPSKQSQLVKLALNSKYVTIKEKQVLLENYLLSRRILSTKSVLKEKQASKQFRLHKKISANMSRGNKNAYPLFTQRDKNFRQYEKQLEKHRAVGVGKNQFCFKINSILLIKGILSKNSSVLYNLRVKVGRNFYDFKALNYQSLIGETTIIRFKKSLLISNPEVLIFLSVLRSNLEQQIGYFKPVITDFAASGNKIYRVMKGSFPAGTIDLEGSVVYYKLNNQES